MKKSLQSMKVVVNENFDCKKKYYVEFNLYAVCNMHVKLHQIERNCQ